MKVRWIFTGLAAPVAILAIGFVLSPRQPHGAASAMVAPAERGVTVLAITRPAPMLSFADRFVGLSFHDRFAGAPIWEPSYASAPAETRTSYASAQPATQEPSRALRAIDAVASRAPTYEVASASASVPVPPSEMRPRPADIASAVAAFGEADSKIAIYDIAAHTVYMPNGERLEAHSGLGERLDNPRYVNVKMKGPTPPNVYKMTMRESIFHGVRAIRLTPVDESKMFGRDGMLAHTYMLRNRGHSNGCVVFSNYPAFLAAFQRGEVDRLVVVDHLDHPPRANSKVASATP